MLAEEEKKREKILKITKKLSDKILDNYDEGVQRSKIGKKYSKCDHLMQDIDDCKEHIIMLASCHQ